MGFFETEAPGTGRAGIGRRDLPPIALLFIAAFLLPGIVLFSLDRLPGADLPQFHLPHQQYLYEHLRDGVIPFWNPYVCGGAPEFGNPEIAPMYPVHLPVLLSFGPEVMLRVKYLFHLGLLAAGFYLLLRALSMPVWAAFLGALTLQTSGFPVTKIALPNVGDSAAWIPMMLFLNLWFARRPTLRRGLIFALAGGCMLLLFFPQITLTLILVLALWGTARFLKIEKTRNGVFSEEWTKWAEGARWTDLLKSPRWWLRRIFLPGAETLLILTLLRYPKDPAYFPEPGWRCAFDGMGKLGIAALVAVVLLWPLWFIAGRFRARFEGRDFLRWAVRFAGIWLFAALFAAPQLAITGELIPQSNQAALAYQSDEDFFTGAQAYGSVREFVELSARAARKESVNNMALGPVVWALVFAGILAGFHRERRVFLLLLVAATLIGAVYMAAPGLFDVFRRLPFFGKFAGLSRYLSFLNIFLILLAALSAQMIVRRLPSTWKPVATALLALLTLANIGLLVRHEAAFWKRLSAQAPMEIPAGVAPFVREHLGPFERVLVDARNRGEDESYPFLMFPFANRLASLPQYGPMRTDRYDRWESAHNRALGADHAHYRAGFMEPSPTPYSRTARVRCFLFPPGSLPPPEPLGPGWALERVGALEGWTLYRDPAPLPVVWPESDLEREPSRPEIPPGWRAEIETDGPNRIVAEVHNPGAETWLVLPFAWYPGWRAWVDGRPVSLRVAYGFLDAVPVPAGSSRIHLEYRPLSFALGWLAFLWAVWAWIVGWRASGTERMRVPLKIFVFGLILGIPVVLAVGARALFSTPDSVADRGLEAGLTIVLAAAAGFAVRRLARRADSA